MPEARGVGRAAPKQPVWVSAVEDAFEAAGICDGAVLSFHHHLRNGDAIMAKVMSVAAARGLRDLTIAPSSLFPVHADIARHIRDGVVTGLWTNYMRGAVADAVSQGQLAGVARFQSHGSRAQAIATGRLTIDAAFIAAPAVGPQGDITGALGAAACGPLGYPQIDAEHSRHVVALVDEVHTTDLPRVEIPARNVDTLVKVDTLGDPAGIASGIARIAEDAESLSIAERTVAVIEAAGALEDGFSFQTGAGGASLATATLLGARMQANGVVGSFISGGICAPHVELVREGLFREIFDVQCFDRVAVASYAVDPWHHAMSASEYASPLHPNPVASRLSVVVLGAAEVDRAFNINVTTAGDGRIIGGPGGHPDTAAGADLTIATTRLTASGYPKLVDEVGTITTPGDTVDVLVTEAGIAVHPQREDLARQLQRAGLPVVPVETLIRLSDAKATRRPRTGTGRVIAVVEDRSGNVLDEIRAVAETASTGAGG